MNRKRNFLIGATFVATFVVLGDQPGHRCRRLRPPRRRPAACRCRASKSIRRSRNRCRITGIRGRRSACRSTRRITSGSSIALIRCSPSEQALDDKTGDVLREGAADSRVRSAGQPRSSLGRHRLGQERRLQVALVEPRHHRRSQRQRVDRRQRRRRRHGAEVHEGRKVPAARRRELPGCRQQRDRSLLEGREAVRRCQGRRDVHRGRLRQQARGHHRQHDRQDEAVLGRATATSRTMRTPAATIRPSRSSSSSARRCTAPSCRTTTSSTSATA